MIDDNRLRHILIVGGGTAGWMTAAALSRFLVDGFTKVTLIESDAIGTVGVGESTIPQIRIFNRLLNLDEDDFVRRTKATFKLAIEFVDWRRIGDRYYHPFGPYGVDMGGVSFHPYYLRALKEGHGGRLDEYSLQSLGAADAKFSRPVPDAGNSPLADIAYAFHFDAGLYASYLRDYAEARGVVRREGRIADVAQHAETGFVESVTLEGGETIEADFYVDCSGFRGLLIEQTLKAGYEDWSHWLMNDRAVAVPCTLGGSLNPVTRATARPAGWQWRIPLQHRLGNGHAYSSVHMSDDEATALLLANLDGEPLADPLALRFTAGRRKKSWDRNVVAIGLAAGFMEPLESQSIHLIQVGISRLMTLLPTRSMGQPEIDLYNRWMTWEYEKIRDFLILHYHATERDDTPYWDHCRTMEVSDYLKEKIAIFRSTGRVFREHDELFNDTSWFAVMMGQGLTPGRYDPIVDEMPEPVFLDRMSQIRRAIRNSVDWMPNHFDFIAKHCASEGFTRP
ncbi:tryptophan halogenase [Nostoc sp. 3335mG]|nr:tryptophan halogenase [Nostoc sp. 3335mG]